MSDIGVTNGTPAASAPSREYTANYFALWALQILLALVFAMAGLAKVFGEQAMVEMFATIGVGQWFRYAVGALEISGAAGLLIPRLLGSAALGLVCLMLGAILTNLFVLGASPLLPLGCWWRAFWSPRATGAVRGVPRPSLALNVLAGSRPHTMTSV